MTVIGGALSQWLVLVVHDVSLPCISSSVDRLPELIMGWIWSPLIPIPFAGGGVVYAIGQLLHRPGRKWLCLVWISIVIYIAWSFVAYRYFGL